MKQVKVFQFVELPDFASDYIFNLALSLMGDNSLDYGAFEYTIGGYETEYDNATENDRKHYLLDEINLSRRITEWFVEYGCEKGETIFIHR